MTRKVKVVVAVAIIILMVVVIFVVGKVFHRQLKDSDFSNLEKAPPNLVVVRRTHFANQGISGIEGALVEKAPREFVARMDARNVSLQKLIAYAYGCLYPTLSEARIVFPTNMPVETFDCMDTVSDNLGKALQKAIEKYPGYTAHWETRSTNVFLLKVETFNAPGLQIGAGKMRGVIPGRVQHLKISFLIPNLENQLEQPVLDETGLTNRYDFKWSFAKTNRAQLDNMLANIGLGLEPTNKPIQMLVVEKVR
jgi:uncharacterized protein (TIGR03435 family)